MENVRKSAELDLEWLELIKEALDVGLTKDEIRTFLKSPAVMSKMDFMGSKKES
ncbi:anti-repressor SinI family protein [Falsibacillus pallidus]|uniref:Anti-repressor SinI n=1 Tax=Falsibacillus pallidus TaxID=493781 RepID=A0A370GI74_9BACI|nr:anti-repressor SinI [Falsibacillus pallidus]